MKKAVLLLLLAALWVSACATPVEKPCADAGYATDGYAVGSRANHQPETPTLTPPT